jgi:N-acetylglutamate synthase-like GNAT family acetyltransferase
MKQDYTIEEFTRSRFRNLWIQPREHVYAYVRKGDHLHPLKKTPLKCFDIANVQVSDTVQEKGIFTAWLAEVMAESKRLGYEAVHVENVLTDRFADYFRKRGWTETSHLTPSFFYIFGEHDNG